MKFPLLLRLLPLVAMVASIARSAPALPLQAGEQLTYRVSWAIVPGAGEIKIAAANDTTGPNPRLRVSTTTATRGFARFLLKFDAEADSLFDARSGRLLSLNESNRQNEKESAHSVVFDYPASQALYSVPNSTEKPRALPMPAGDPFDLITCLVQTRSWNLKPGETRDALVLFDDDFYELTIHAARYEELSTSLGTFKTIVLEPRMDKTPPKGMFRKGSSVRVWISLDDERRLPVKFEVEFKIGTGVATLTQYQPPTAPKPAGEAPSATPGKSATDAKNPGP